MFLKLHLPETVKPSGGNEGGPCKLASIKNEEARGRARASLGEADGGAHRLRSET